MPLTPTAQWGVMSEPELDYESGEPVSRQLAAIIRQRIASGRYPPGRRIMSLSEAVGEFGISSKTFQKTTRILREEGVIRTVPGMGSFVIEQAERQD